MANVVEGLFGLSPYEVQQQQMVANNQMATRNAQMPLMQSAREGFGMVGAQLAQPVAGMLGLQNKAVMDSEARQAALQGLDIRDPQAILARAQQIQDPKLKMQLMMLAQQQQAEQQKIAREEFKMKDEFEWKKEQKRMEIEQRAEAARLRSEDARLGIEQRREAAREANALRSMLGQLAAQTKAATGQKSLTASQQLKLKKDMAASQNELSSLESAYTDLFSKGMALKEHPGLPGVTGARGVFPSVPGGSAAQAEALLDEYKSAVRNAGLQLVREGGSIGQMTVQEWPIVEGMIANIDPKKLGLKGTKEAIDKAINRAEATLKRARRLHEDTFADVAEAVPASAPPPLASPAARSPTKAVDFGSLK